MNRCLRAAIGLVALVGLAPGCGSSADAPAKVITAKDAGPNARIKFKEEYKQMIGKDGQLLFKPSESRRRPPGIPKS